MKRKPGEMWRSSGHRLISEVVRASNRLTKSADRFLSPWGLTSAQYDLLVVLGPHVAGLGQSEAGAQLGVTRANVTGLVRRLQTRGLCRVDIRTDDARAKSVRTTPAGTRLLARLDGPWHAWILLTAKVVPKSLHHRLSEAVERLAPAHRAALN